MIGKQSRRVPVATVVRPASESTPVRAVTLISGDRVVLSAGGDHAIIERGAGRNRIRFVHYWHGGHLHVIPEDARLLVASNRLDPAVFDVTALSISDEHRRGVIPLTMGGETIFVSTEDAGGRWPELAAQLADRAVTAAPTAESSAPAEEHGETYWLTVRHLGPDGVPTRDAESLVFGLDVPVREHLYDESGTARISLPAGRYTLVGDVVDATSNWYRLYQPTIQLDRDTTVTVDARTALPVTTFVEHTAVRPAFVSLGVARRGETFSFRNSVEATDFSRLFAAQIGPDVSDDELTTALFSVWAVPDGNDGFETTPVTYNLINTVHGRFLNGFSRVVHDRELGTQRAVHHAQRRARQAAKVFFVRAPGFQATTGAVLPYDLPSRVTHHLESGTAEWAAAFGEQAPDEDGFPTYISAMGQDYATYAAGEQYTERWNATVFGPSFYRDDHAGGADGRMWFGVPLYTDQDNHRGGAATDDGSIIMYRQGERIGESAGSQLVVQVPPGRADFRVVNRSVRDSLFDCSTRVDVTWGFTFDPGEPAPPPLWVVRYCPEVDEHNRAADAPVISFPVAVESHPRAKVGEPVELSVECSGDEGESWLPTEVTRTSAHGFHLTLVRPDGATTISLRASLLDSDGNTVTQTVIRALRLTIDS